MSDCEDSRLVLHAPEVVDPIAAESPTWTMTAGDYVRALYRLCLGREPDDRGLEHWSSTLTASGDPTLILAALLETPEANRHLAQREGISGETAATYVRAIYRLALGREPDPRGLEHWSNTLVQSGDAILVFAALLESPEVKRHLVDREGISAEIASEALALLGRRPRIVDVGAQVLADEPHAYRALQDLGDTDVIGFEPLADRVDERLLRESAMGGTLVIMPFAIGDGETHTLYITNEDASSSLFPLNLEHNAPFNHISGLRVKRSVQVQTRRLDDVLDPGPVDFLKLDVQGAELMALSGAPQTLSSTAVVHCETEFSPIYLGQPLFPAIHELLDRHGFYFVDLIASGRYSYSNQRGIDAIDRLIWGDAIFFRQSDDAAILLAQAIVAAAVYKKPSMAAYLLDRARQQLAHE